MSVCDEVHVCESPLKVRECAVECVRRVCVCEMCALVTHTRHLFVKESIFANAWERARSPVCVCVVSTYSRT